jgi:uncharacterized protein YqjF (DUF2071 family)
MGTVEPEDRSSYEGAPPPPAAPQRVRLPVNVHHWDHIAFLHWPYRPADIAHVVPDGTTLLTSGGMAWVTITPFFIRVRAPGVPFVPPRWAFPETNLRTYVASADGRQGLWFLHMEVSAAWFVATLRSLGLPYFRRHMSVDVARDQVVYRSQPSSASTDGGHHVVIVPGSALSPPEGGPWERFVTARWGAFHSVGGRLLYTPVEHEPWRLQAATVPVCSVDALFREAGLPAPAGPPVAHFSPGVKVRVGVPKPIR